MIKKQAIIKVAQNLFDNRLGWSEGRDPYAPLYFWIQLGWALYGKDDPRVQDLIHEEDIQMHRVLKEVKE